MRFHSKPKKWAILLLILCIFIFILVMTRYERSIRYYIFALVMIFLSLYSLILFTIPVFSYTIGEDYLIIYRFIVFPKQRFRNIEYIEVEKEDSYHFLKKNSNDIKKGKIFSAIDGGNEELLIISIRENSTKKERKILVSPMECNEMYEEILMIKSKYK